jgi:hypothetical protein
MAISEMKFGFLISLVVTILLSAGLELSGIWLTMLIAGFVGGFMTRRLQRGIAVGFLGVLVGWALYFLSYWIIAPNAANIAFSAASSFVILTLLLGGILGTLSGAMGALVSSLVLAGTDDSAKKQPSG